MPLSKLMPKSYHIRLILIMFFLGVIPFIIFGLLMSSFDTRFKKEIDQAISEGQAEEDRRSTAILTQMAEDAIRQKALDVTLQLELYIQSHPEMTVPQLQRDETFRAIAVQPVLRTGYTAVYNAENAITLFHRNPKIENLDLSSLRDKLPAFWSIIKNSLSGKFSHGYYEWKDADGIIRTKFMYIAPLSRKTPDGVHLTIAATAYMEEFIRPIKITREVSYGTSRFLAMTFHHLLGSLKLMGFFFIGVGLIVSIALASWAGTFFSRTLIDLRNATRSVANGNLDIRVNSNMTGDVGELTKDFNRMVTNLTTTTVKKEKLEAKQEELRNTNRQLQQEVTERKNAQEALRESKERLKAIIETNPNPIVVYNNNGFPDYLNMAFTRVFGWTLAELDGRHIPFVPEKLKASTAEKEKEIFHSAVSVSFESARLTKDGKMCDVLISAAPFKGPENEVLGAVVNFADITETKRLKAQLQHAQKMEAIGTLAGGIAHNFNNVLMGIQGMTSLILMKKKPGDPDIKHLTSIEEYSKNAAELTKGLLAFARGGKYQVRPTDLNQLIKHESDMFARTKKELLVSGEYQHDLWPVAVDQGQLRQALMNLFLNAWQAMPSGGNLHLKTENVIIHEDYVMPFKILPGQYVRLSLTDTGVGMDEETMDKIFEPFFTTREIGKGTGLGLASVYGIIKNHNGFINVDSEKGTGTTFTIHLPASEKELEVKTELYREIVKGTETILLVDDEEMITDVGRQLLETLGYSVLIAQNGQEAIDIYKKKKDNIDFVILDLIMPGMGAGETYDKLKEQNPHIKVLLSSGYSINGRTQEIIARGCNGFIQKPFNLVDISQKIRNLIDGDNPAMNA